MQCFKIAQFLQQVRQIEILSMLAEFVRDECGNIWFIYASKIHYRKVETEEFNDLAEE